MNKITIDYKRSNEVGYDFIDEILKIDAAVYEKHLQGTKNSLTARFNANRESYILAFDGEKIIGYICFFPISGELSRKMQEENKALDDDIEVSDILPEYPKDIDADVFVISIAISPDYQHKDIGKQLIKDLFRFLFNKNHAGCKIRNILLGRVTSIGTLRFRKFKIDDYKMSKENNHENKEHEA